MAELKEINFMTKRQERINELRKQASMIQFLSVLSEEDYKTLDKIDAEIKRLEAKQHGGWVIKVTVHNTSDSKFDYSYYLTEDETLCCCDEPTFFKTKKEAQAVLNKHKFKDSQWYYHTVEIRKEVR